MHRRPHHPLREAVNQLPKMVDAKRSHLKKGDVFTQDALDIWIKYKTDMEINPVNPARIYPGGVFTSGRLPRD